MGFGHTEDVINFYLGDRDPELLRRLSEMDMEEAGGESGTLSQLAAHAAGHTIARESPAAVRRGFNTARGGRRGAQLAEAINETWQSDFDSQGLSKTPTQKAPEQGLRFIRSNPSRTPNGTRIRTPAILRLSGSELGRNLQPIDLRIASRDAVKARLRNGQIQRIVDRPEIGPIQITVSGAKHVKSEAVSLDAVKTLPYVDRLIKEGTYLGSMEHLGQDPNILRWHYIISPVEVGGRRLQILIAIREHVSGQFFYHLDEDVPQAFPLRHTP